MFCPESIVLERYALGELASDQTTGLEAHLESCVTCREEVAHHQRRARGELPAEPKTAPGNPSVPVAAFGSGVALDVEAPIQLTNLVSAGKEPVAQAAEQQPLDQPITELRPTLAPGPGGSTLFLERGTRVGRYVILEQIGSGGMGVVYAAMDPELDRKVALKLLRSTGNDAPGAPSEARIRLLREAQAMARLSHPNVITIHDVGSHFSQVYLAMELVQGTTLTEWLRAKRTWREVVRVFCKAGQGLAAAHQAGLVHRDFKPDNVLVGDDGSVHVMDFGLARAATRDEGDGPWRAPDPQSGAEFLLSALTRQGTVVGTPAYMSPEQFVDDPLDARSDQFSFCVALYEALYGKLPYEGETVKELAIRVMGGQVPRFPPRARAPLGVHRALVKGLNPSPSRRHPSMGELVRALEHAAWFPRRGIAAGMVALAVIAGAVWTWQTASLRAHACMSADAERQLADLWGRGRKRALHQAFRATGVSFAEETWKGVERALDAYSRQWISTHDAICDATWGRKEQPENVFNHRMACLGERRRELGTLSELFAHADARVVEKAVQATNGLSSIAACLAIDTASLRAAPRTPSPEHRQELQELRGRLSEASALRGAEVVPRALALCREVVEGARKLGDRPLEAEALLLLGRLVEQGGDYPGAEQTLLEAYWAAEAGQQHELAARALTGLVTVVGQRQNRNAEGRRWGRAAGAILEGLGQPADPRAQLLASLALVDAAEGQHAEAAEKLREALRLREEKLGPAHVEVALTLQELGTMYRTLGRYEEALASQQRAVPIIERTFGPDHPRLARALNHEGIALKSLGRLDEARVVLERALSVDERAFGAEAPAVAVTINNLASVLEEQNRLDDAAAAYQRALAIEEKAARPNPVRLAMELNNLGDVYLKQGQHARALEHFQKALGLRQGALGAEHFDVAKDLLGLGETYLAMRRLPMALQALERALALREAHPGFPTTLARIRFALARALWESGKDKPRAKQLAEQAKAAYANGGPGNASEHSAVEGWISQHGG